MSTRNNNTVTIPVELTKLGQVLRTANSDDSNPVNATMVAHYIIDRYKCSGLMAYWSTFDKHTTDEKLENIRHWAKQIENGTFDYVRDEDDAINVDTVDPADDDVHIPGSEPAPKSTSKPKKLPSKREPVTTQDEVAAAMKALTDALKNKQTSPVAESVDTEAMLEQLRVEMKLSTTERFKMLKTTLDNLATVKVAEQAEALIKANTKTYKFDDSNIVNTVTGACHYKLPLLIAAVKCRIPAMLVGPAGWAKTSTVYKMAKALEVDVYGMSIGPATTKSDILGYHDANGNYSESQTYKAFKFGGVLLVDEFDAGSAQSLTYLNSILANDQAAFPNGVVNRHKDFIPVACANTYGIGANAVYVGRSALDGATLDRFAMIDWDYDPALEAEIIGVAPPLPAVELDIDAGGEMNRTEWLSLVTKYREGIDRHGIKQIASMRASINGAKMLALGVGATHVKQMCLYKGQKKDIVSKILGQ